MQVYIQLSMKNLSVLNLASLISKVKCLIILTFFDRKIESQQIRLTYKFVSQFKIFFNILICSEESPCTPEGNKLKRSTGNMEEAYGSIKSTSDEGSNGKENSKKYGLQNCKP